MVDDGSTDGTAEWLAGQAGIVAMRQQPNAGKPAALNRGIAAATGEFLLILDDDDRLLPGAARALVGPMLARPDAVAVLAYSATLDGESGAATGMLPALRLPESRFADAMLAQVPGLPGATLVRLSAQRQAGDYNPRLNMLEDMDMYLRLARQGPILSLPLPVLLYRVHKGARGGATDRLDPQAYQTAFRLKRAERAAEAFVAHWQAERGQADRRRCHHWALGLKRRLRPKEAVEAIVDWPGPWTAEEAQIRRFVGLAAPDSSPRAVLALVHDGEAGALADCLDRQPAGLHAIVSLLLPEARLGAIELFWPGSFAPQDRPLRDRLLPLPVLLRLSSAPDWAPPPLSDPALLPRVSGNDGDRVALWATALALGWPLPQPSRSALPPPDHPLLQALRRVQSRAAAGAPCGALMAVAAILSSLPDWKAAWRLGAQLAQDAGRPAEAALFAAKGRCSAIQRPLSREPLSRKRRARKRAAPSQPRSEASLRTRLMPSESCPANMRLGLRRSGRPR